MLCFSPDGKMVHAGPLHTPSMNASGTMASFWAAMSVAGSERVCAATVDGSAAVIVRTASVASRCLAMSVLLECANSIVPGKNELKTNWGRSWLMGLSALGDISSITSGDDGAI